MKYNLTALPSNKPAMALRHRLFFREEEESVCYSILGHIMYMKENSLPVLRLRLAQRETNTACFFCKHFWQVGEKKHCGWWCNGYAPRNGKGGICKHWGHTYEPTREFLLTLQPDEQ